MTSMRTLSRGGEWRDRARNSGGTGIVAPRSGRGHSRHRLALIFGDARTLLRAVTRQDAAARIAGLLAELRAARDPAREPRNRLPRLAEVKQWQAERLALSFFDLTAKPRLAAASRFFLDDLYGAHDVAWRDRDIARMLPTLRSWLPSSVLRTVADALELDLLSHRLDLELAESLTRDLEPGTALDQESYAAAYRDSSTRAERKRQLTMLLRVGGDLDRIVQQPLVYTMLKIARGPANVAGLGQLQSFLERGFAAFRKMGDATEFLVAIEARESEAMRRLFEGKPDPFSLGPRTTARRPARPPARNPAARRGGARSRARSGT